MAGKFADPRLGARVRELRRIRGWSQRELGRRTGSNKHAVGRDENTGQFGLKRIRKYAAAFGVKPALITEVLDEV